MTVSRFVGFERDAAARLVFLMSLPIIAGAGVFSLADAEIPSDFWPPFLWGMATSAVTARRPIGERVQHGKFVRTAHSANARVRVV